MSELEDDYAIGLDLGTTFSCIGVYRNGWVEIMPNRNGNKITPSVVIIKDNGEILVGEETTNFLVENYDSCIYEVKRLIGRHLDKEEIERLQNRLSFKIINSKDNFTKIQIGGKEFTPVEISSFIIKKMVKNAEKYLNKKIKKLVITVPANFNDSQRKLTRQAAELLDLEVLRVINEPTAAALAYGFDEKNINNNNILVFDLGGGTFDVSILALKKNSIDNSTIFDVLGTNGDVALGGEDFDNKLVEFVLKNLEDKKVANMIKKDKKAMKRLKVACENTKKNLSNSNEVHLRINEIIQNADISVIITREDFERECKPLFDKLIEPMKNALTMANLQNDQINEVILVGGSTRIPKIIEIVKNYFPKCKKINNSLNPDEAIAYGATIEAEKILHNKDKIIKNFALFDITPFSLGTDVSNDSTDPEIKKEGCLMNVIIQKGTHIPCSGIRTYYSSYDNQVCMSINVYEGEKKYVKYNHLIKQYNINGLKKLPKGEAQITMKFDIDKSGILNVEAKEISAGDNGKSENFMIINDDVSLTDEDKKKLKEKIDEMINKIGNGKIGDIEYSNIKGILKKYSDSLEDCKKKTKLGEEENEEEDNSIIFLTNYYTTLEDFINKFDKNFDNETVLSKFYLYIKDLFLHYLEAFNYELEKEDKTHIFEEINKNIQIFTDKSSGYLNKLLEILSNMQKSKKKDVKVNFYKTVVNIIARLNQLGKDCLVKDKPFAKYHSLIYFEQAYSILEKYFPKQPGQEERKNVGLLPAEYLQKINQEGKDCYDYLESIKSGTILFCEEFLEKGLLFNSNITSSERGFTNTFKNANLGRIALENINNKRKILAIYYDLLSKIQTINPNSLKEAVCIACILKIENFNENSGDKSYILLSLGERAETIVNNLSNSNDIKSKKWYQEFVELYSIIKEKNKIKNETYDKILNKIKKKHKKTFDEIDNKFNTLPKKEFIKFIITNYPYENIENDKKKVDFSTDNPDLLHFLLKKYNPDEHKYLEGDEPSELKHCKYQEISKKLNAYYTNTNNKGR